MSAPKFLSVISREDASTIDSHIREFEKDIETNGFSLDGYCQMLEFHIQDGDWLRAVAINLMLQKHHKVIS